MKTVLTLSIAFLFVNLAMSQEVEFIKLDTLRINECTYPCNLQDSKSIKYDYQNKLVLPIILISNTNEFDGSFEFIAQERREIRFSKQTISRDGSYLLANLIIEKNLTDVQPIEIRLYSKTSDKTIHYLIKLSVLPPIITDIVILTESNNDILDLTKGKNEDFILTVSGKNFYSNTTLKYNGTINFDNELSDLTNESFELRGQLRVENFPYEPYLSITNGSPITERIELSNISPIMEFENKPIRLLAERTSTINLKGKYLPDLKDVNVVVRSSSEGAPEIKIRKLIDESFKDFYKLELQTGSFNIPHISQAKYTIVFQDKRGRKSTINAFIKRNSNNIDIYNSNNSNFGSKDEVVIFNHKNRVRIINTDDLTLKNDFSQVSLDKLILIINDQEVKQAKFIDPTTNSINIEFNYDVDMKASELSRVDNVILKIITDDDNYIWEGYVSLIPKPFLTKRFTKGVINIRPEEEIKIIIEGYNINKIKPVPNAFFDIRSTSSTSASRQRQEFSITLNNDYNSFTEGFIEFSDGSFRNDTLYLARVNWQDPKNYLLIKRGKRKALTFEEMSISKIYDTYLERGIQFILDKSKLDKNYENQVFQYLFEINGQRGEWKDVEITKNTPTTISADLKNVKIGEKSRLCIKTPESYERCINFEFQSVWYDRFFVIPSITTTTYNFSSAGINTTGTATGIGVGWQPSNIFGLNTSKLIGFNISLNTLPEFKGDVSNPVTLLREEAILRESGFGLSGGLVLIKSIVVNIGLDFREANRLDDSSDIYFIISGGIPLSFPN